MTYEESRKKGFDKLRLSRAGGAVAAGMAISGKAYGVTTGTGQTFTIGGVEWSNAGVNNAIFTPLTQLPSATGSAAYGLADDAALAGLGRGDAFDDLGGMLLNGVAFNQSTNQIDLTTTADGTFISGLAPVNIAGIDASLDFFYDSSSPTARSFATFTNTTGETQNVNVAYGGNLGSDDDTVFQDSSNGDAVFDQATDGYIISSDGDPSTGDPVITFARFGGPNVQVPSSTPDVPGITGDLEDYVDIWSLSLDPGETQSLMMFVQLNDSLASSQAGAAAFDDLGTLQAAGLTAGLSLTQLGATVNWAGVPEPSSFLLLGVVVCGVAIRGRFAKWWRRFFG